MNCLGSVDVDGKKCKEVANTVVSSISMTYTCPFSSVCGQLPLSNTIKCSRVIIRVCLFYAYLMLVDTVVLGMLRQRRPILAVR